MPIEHTVGIDAYQNRAICGGQLKYGVLVTLDGVYNFTAFVSACDPFNSHFGQAAT